MAKEIRAYTEVLRDMLADVKANIDEAKMHADDCVKKVNRINAELETSGEELAEIKVSLLNVRRQARKAGKAGITADEARDVANRFSRYAETVDHISDEKMKLSDATAELSTADSDVLKKEDVQQKIEDLMSALGML